MAKMPEGLRRYWATHRRGGKSKARSRSLSMRARSHHKKSFTVPLAIVAGFAPVAANTVSHIRSNGFTGPESGVAELSRTMVGYDPYDMNKGWQVWRLKYGLYPALAGIIVHKVVGGWLGVNRALGQAGIPIIRL